MLKWLLLHHLLSILLSSPPHLLLLLMMCAIFEGSEAGDLLTFNSKLIAAGMSVVGGDVKHVTNPINMMHMQQ